MKFIVLLAFGLWGALAHSHEHNDVTHIHSPHVQNDDHHHEHSHDDHHHVHEHKGCSHSHEVETNVHKLFAKKIGDLIGFAHFMQFLEVGLQTCPPILQGILSTVFITIVPILFIYLINALMSAKSRESFVYVMMSFGLGGLLGDVFFHTLPHIMEGHGHSHDHSHEHSHEHGHGGHSHSAESMYPSIIILVGIFSFFLLERIIDKYFSAGHSHGHSHGANKEDEAAKDKEKQLRYTKFAVISMMGDFLHNVTDGLSIGVSYLVDYKFGLTTTIAMFFHEIPHEVGDFVLLYQLKFSLWQIVGLQLCTGLGSVIGSMVGYYVGQLYL